MEQFQNNESKHTVLSRSNLSHYKVDETAKVLGVHLSFPTQGNALNKQKAFKIPADRKRYFTKFMSMGAKALIMKIFILPKLTHLLRQMKIEKEVLQEYKKFTKNVLWGPRHKALMAEVSSTRKPREGGIGWPNLMTSILAKKLFELLNKVNKW